MHRLVLEDLTGFKEWQRFFRRSQIKEHQALFKNPSVPLSVSLDLFRCPFYEVLTRSKSKRGEVMENVVLVCVSAIDFWPIVVVLLKASDLLWHVNIGKGLRDNVLDRGMH